MASSQQADPSTTSYIYIYVYPHLLASSPSTGEMMRSGIPQTKSQDQERTKKKKKRRKWESASRRAGGEDASWHTDLTAGVDMSSSLDGPGLYKSEPVLRGLVFLFTPSLHVTRRRRTAERKSMCFCFSDYLSFLLEEHGVLRGCISCATD